MRSRASFKGHPIHTALIPFPFAFLIGAVFFDTAGVFFELEAWLTTARHLALAGVVTALVAAVPGAIDYVYTVPPRSSGRRRATRHMLTNLAAVTLMAIALTQRRSPMPGAAALAFEWLSAVLLCYGSSLGGVLVTRNQISIDHRYADAGKWKEPTITSTSGAIEVAATDELETNQMKLLRVGDARIVLARGESGYVAFDDHCTHRGGSLAGGSMICDTVQCPWHGSQFNVRSGAVRAGPAKQPIRTYKVETREGKVFLVV